jgi:TonB family protein
MLYSLNKKKQLVGFRFPATVAALLLWLVMLGSSAPSSIHLRIPAVEAKGFVTRGFLPVGDQNIEEYAVAQVQPPYPTAAQRYRIEGTVTVHLNVNKDGKVTKADFVRGHTIFRSASLDAAKQWLFDTRNNASLEGIITFVFKLK